MITHSFPVMQKILIFSLVWLLVGCSSATTLDYDDEQYPPERNSVAYLKALGSKGEVRLSEELAVDVVITANDRHGEWSEAIVVEDETGGITIAVQGAERYRHYPFGGRLRLYCNGLTLRNYGGKIELCREADTYGQRGLSEEEQAAHLHPLTTTEAPIPQSVTIDQLNNHLIDRLILLQGVEFVEKGSWCATDPLTQTPLATKHQIRDVDGHTLAVYVAATCHYANEPLPEGNGSLCGILDYFGGEFALRVSNFQVNF